MTNGQRTVTTLLAVVAVMLWVHLLRGGEPHCFWKTKSFCVP